MSIISPNTVAEVLVEVITGKSHHPPKIINLTSRTRGDLSFPLNRNYWRGYVDVESTDFKNAENILHYFRLKYCKDDCMEADNNKIISEIENKVRRKLYKIYGPIIEESLFKVQCFNDYVSINFNRQVITSIVIKHAIEEASKYGKNQACKKYFYLKTDFDNESEITNMRLNLLKTVSINLLNAQNYEVCDKECTNGENYIYTTRSEGRIDDRYIRYLCGPVLNINNRKEKDLKKETYLQRRIEKIKKLNAQRNVDMYINETCAETDIQKIANASINYELLSIKHTSPVIMKNSAKLDTCVKETSFILYNNARINGIFDKYSKLVLDGEFPEIFPIKDTYLFEELADVDSWNLIYYYIVSYPDMLKATVTFEPKFTVNIQLLWSFISNLCHEFSKYYRKNQILMKGSNPNDQVIKISTERLYMAKALQIILQNSLSILEINQVTYM